MGGNSSKASISNGIVNNIVNETDINLLNEGVYNTTINSTTSNSSQCSLASSAYNGVTFSHLVCGQDCNLNINQDADIFYDMSCFATDNFITNIVSDVSQQMNDQIMNSTDQNAQQAIANAIATAQSQGWASFPWQTNKSNGEVNNYVQNNITDETNVTLQDILQVSLYANLVTSNYQDCVSNAVSSQSATVEDVTAGRNINLSVTQTATISAVLKCIFSSNFSTNAMNEVVNGLGFNLTNTDEQESISEYANQIETKQETQGFFQAIAEAIDSFFGNIFKIGALGLFASGSLISCCLVCCSLIILLIIFFVLKK